MASEIILTNEVTPSTPSTGTTKIFVNSSKQLSVVDDAGTVTSMASGGISSGTATALSGTSTGFTGLPSSTKKITLGLYGASLSGTANILIQLGTSGGYVTSGYLGSYGYSLAATSGAAASTTGWQIGSGTATFVFHGVIVLMLVDSTNHYWEGSGSFGQSDSVAMRYCAGGLPLGGVIDRVRVVSSNGTDTFDAGTINILYE